MQQYLKERLLGLVTLLLVMVVFIPYILGGEMPSADLGYKTDTSANNDASMQTSVAVDIQTSSVPPLQDILLVEQPPINTAATAVEDGVVSISPTTLLEAQQMNDFESGSPVMVATDENQENVSLSDSVIDNTEILQITETDLKKTLVINEPPATTDNSLWILQVGSFATATNAQSLEQRLQTAGYDTFIEPAKSNGREIWRVRVGPYSDRIEAEASLKTLIQQKEVGDDIVVLPYIDGT